MIIISLSGQDLSEELIEKYRQMRFLKEPQGFILKIEDEKLVLEDHTKESFQTLVKALPENEPRFVLYDFPMKNRVGLDDTRMLFLFWMPMSSHVRLKIQYASAKNLINTKFPGISTQLQEEEKKNLDFENVKKFMANRQGSNYQQRV